MDTGDTEAGRTIVVFEDGAYEPEKIGQEASHFSILPSATARGLTAKGPDKLALSGGFGAELNQQQILGRIGDMVDVQAILMEAPAEVHVTVKKGDRVIAAEIAEISSGKEIRIPVEKENIGELSLIFTSGEDTAVTRLILSGYSVTYGEGRYALKAEAQADGLWGLHRDTAKISIFNGADRPQLFSIGSMEGAYEDGTPVTLDRDKVSVDMPAEQAMINFGLSIEGDSAVSAGGTLELSAVLENGDLINAEKKGSINLKEVSLGEAQTTISLEYTTHPVTRLQMMVRKDGGLYSGCRLWLQDAAGNRTDLVEQNIRTQNILLRASQRELWPYRITGLAPGSYRLYANGIDTGRMVTIETGSVAEESLEFYSLKLQLNGGILEDAPESYLQGMTLALPEPNREGYRFGGWYTTEDYSQAAVTSIPPQSEGAYQLYAKWLTEDGSQVVDPIPDPGSGQDSGQGPTEPQQPDNSENLGTPQPQPPVLLEEQPHRDRTPLLARIFPKKTSGQPKTGDQTIIITDIALIGGMAYLMKLFAKQAEGAGMSEEQKDTLLYHIIEKAKGKNHLLRLGALLTIGVVLLYYYTLGMKEEAKELQNCRKNFVG